MILPRIDELLAGIKWPQLDKARYLLTASDTLVTCAGFEDRSLAYLSGSVDSGCRGFRIIGVDYRPEVLENRVGELNQLAKRADAELTVITYDRQEGERAGEIFEYARRAKRILLDISGMSRLLIVQLIAAAVRENLVHRVEVIYTEAGIYPPTQEEVAARLDDDKDYFSVLNFISSGVLGITIVPELSTIAMQGQPIRLVAFPSFNPTQLAAVCAEIQASSFSIVNGVPPSVQNSWRREAIRRLNNIDSIREKEEFNASTLDYRETLRLLLDLYRKHGALEKLVISPTGSKMQSVAVGIACGFLRDLQVVYPTPRSFPSPSNYTKGAIGTYRLCLEPFSALARASEEVAEEIHTTDTG